MPLSPDQLSALQAASTKLAADAQSLATAVSGLVADVPVVTPPPPPVDPPPVVTPAVTNLKVTATSTSTVTLGWTNTGPAAVISVARDGVEAGGGSPNWSGTMPVGSTSITFGNLASNTTYHFTIAPVGGTGGSIAATTGGATVTPPPPPPPPNGGNVTPGAPAGNFGSGWKQDPARSWDFSKMADGAPLPSKLSPVRYPPNKFDWDYGWQTANSQVDARQTYIKGGALRLGVGIADAAAQANAAGNNWKYVVGLITGKPGLFINNNEIIEFDLTYTNWAKGRWDALWALGLIDPSNPSSEIWGPEFDHSETDNSWGTANITNTTGNWHFGYGSNDGQTGPTAWNPAIDVTKPHTYTMPRINDTWGVWCDGVQRVPNLPQMTPQQAALSWYPILGASVRAGFNNVPTGDAIVVTAIRTWVKA